MTTSESLPVKEEFDLHVAHTTDMHKSFIESSLRVAGFLLLALGWFATSNDAREFLASARSVTVLAALAVAFAYLLSVGASWVAYKFSCKAAQRLTELAYLPQSAYEGRILGTSTFFICIFGNGVLAVLLIVALLSMP